MAYFSCGHSLPPAGAIASNSSTHAKTVKGKGFAHFVPLTVFSFALFRQIRGVCLAVAVSVKKLVFLLPNICSVVSMVQSFAAKVNLPPSAPPHSLRGGTLSGLSCYLNKLVLLNFKIALIYPFRKPLLSASSRLLYKTSLFCIIPAELVSTFSVLRTSAVLTK